MIRLYNTFELVIPLWKYLYIGLRKKNIQVEGIVSGGQYRKNHKKEQEYLNHLWIPSFLRKDKKWCHIFYYLVAPFYILRKKSSLNIFFTQPPLFFIFGSFFSRLVKTPYIIHIMDMHPDMLSSLDILKEKSFLYKTLNRMAIHSYKKAHKIIVIGRCMKNRLIQKGINENKIEYLPNFTFSEIKPVEKSENKFLTQNNLNDKFIILYSGNMGKPHEFNTILNVAKNLKSYDDIKFIFIGGGGKHQEVKDFAAENSNILMMDYQPIDLLPSVLAAGNIHFISLRQKLSGILVPSKFYSSLATARPIIYEGDEESELALAIKENKSGQVVPPGDQKNLKNSLLFYYNNREKCENDGKNGYLAYQNKYKQEIAIEKYIKMLDALQLKI